MLSDEETTQEMERFMRYEHQKLIRYIRKIAGNPQDAEDIAQETYAKAWIRRADIQNRNHLERWMYTTARNLTVNRIKRKELESRTLEAMRRLKRPDAQDQHTQEALAVKELLGKLPQELRAVAERRYVDGYRHREIAEELDMPIGTVQRKACEAKNGSQNS